MNTNERPIMLVKKILLSKYDLVLYTFASGLKML